MRTAAGSGIVLAKFRVGAAALFFDEPLHELFGETCALDDLVPPSELDRIESRLAGAKDHEERVRIVEGYLLSRRRPREPDPLVMAAVQAIHAERDSLRIDALARSLHLSQDALEKRFRRAVGASPKQLASLVRLRHAVKAYRPGESLSRLSVDAGYYDQSHFIREFRAAMGEPPRRFLRAAEYC